ncbi:MAG: HAD hydrolase-like protein [Clostridia bacterium]|nr:HAD hydrolase-like protein [Clostridia bacterium]
MLKYPCLVLDHDDTVVMSTPTINYPSFLESLAVLRPNYSISYDEFIAYCFEPGFHEFIADILGYDEEEQKFEFDTWQRYIKTHIPDFYPDMAALVERQKREGGLLCVVSHSGRENILRDYRTHCAVEPDIIFGWELGEQKRKPNPYPLNEIMRLYNLSPRDVLMVDDLLPGLTMANACKVDFAYAGWTTTVKEIAAKMCALAPICLSSVKELYRLQFGEGLA